MQDVLLMQTEVAGGQQIVNVLCEGADGILKY